ncbi:SIAE, partial [Symbiodinium sp. CCMP2456]
RSASAAGNVSFAEVFGDYMVLQQHPAKAAVFGSASGVAKVSLKVAEHGIGYIVEADVKDGQWKALLTPTFKGGDWTITATAGDATVVLKHVAFGDVWYCSGQSNMALPLKYTLSRNQSVEGIKANKFDIRIQGMSGNMNPTQPWMKAADAISQPAACDEGDCLFFRYSSTCWYFAESLVEKLGKEASPIGLIHTAWGGSMIEAWLDNKTISTCKNATLTAGNQKYHDERVMPYVGMTLKGWIWYQGENDMHGTHGNSELGYGYGCLMPALVRSWRALWSAADGTTQPDAPFGFVTLAASGSEGGNSMGAMRWAQTANYGVAPNPAMPNTFMAQAFDLDDPFSNITCYRAGCCGDNPKPACWSCLGPNGYCASLSAANYYMGPIHPRDKKPVGERLARAGAAVAYGKPGIFTGPTLSGCSVAGNKITVHFNNSLLYSEKVVVQDYQKIKSSRLEVLTNRSLFCLQTSGRKTEQCIDDGTGHATDQGPYDDTQTTWVAVDVTSAGPNSIAVDLTKSGGKAFAIRYAWQGPVIQVLSCKWCAKEGEVCRCNGEITYAPELFDGYVYTVPSAENAYKVASSSTHKCGTDQSGKPYAVDPAPWHVKHCWCTPQGILDILKAHDASTLHKKECSEAANFDFDQPGRRLEEGPQEDDEDEEEDEELIDVEDQEETRPRALLSRQMVDKAPARSLKGDTRRRRTYSYTPWALVSLQKESFDSLDADEGDKQISCAYEYGVPAASSAQHQSDGPYSGPVWEVEDLAKSWGNVSTRPCWIRMRGEAGERLESCAVALEKPGSLKDKAKERVSTAWHLLWFALGLAVCCTGLVGVQVVFIMKTLQEQSAPERGAQAQQEGLMNNMGN